MDKLRLIAEIRKRPALWDNRGATMKYKKIVPYLWQDVAASMGEGVTVAQCRRCWKALLTHFATEHKCVKLSIDMEKELGLYDPDRDYDSQWNFYKHLKFLEDIVGQRHYRFKEKELVSDTYRDKDNNEEFENPDGQNFQDKNKIRPLAEEEEVGCIDNLSESSSNVNIDDAVGNDNNVKKSLQNDHDTSPIETENSGVNSTGVPDPAPSEKPDDSVTLKLKYDSTQVQKCKLSAGVCKRRKYNYDQVFTIDGL